VDIDIAFQVRADTLVGGEKSEAILELVEGDQ
jgi:hypothetical protein